MFFQRKNKNFYKTLTLTIKMQGAKKFPNEINKLIAQKVLGGQLMDSDQEL